ncbi:hypothetical protein DYB31_010248 [Aphanomyces astaci]|uniref:Uncharacterized protein n=1 Tax=Aphanomyces astaci TaxID=112090 RepID=A0A397FBE3_APHAT|nr:hypothetical protein DYB31_010248 [Aphanomyces astaci]
MVLPAAHFENPFRILLGPGQDFFMQTAGHQEFGVPTSEPVFVSVPGSGPPRREHSFPLPHAEPRSRVGYLNPSNVQLLSIAAFLIPYPRTPLGLRRGDVSTKGRSAADVSAGLFNGDCVSGQYVGGDTCGDPSSSRFLPGVDTRALSLSSNGTRSVA